jgi:hypothetical protein
MNRQARARGRGQRPRAHCAGTGYPRSGPNRRPRPGRIGHDRGHSADRAGYFHRTGGRPSGSGVTEQNRLRRGLVGPDDAGRNGDEGGGGQEQGAGQARIYEQAAGLEGQSPARRAAG